MMRLVRFLIYASLFAAAAFADVGVLIPGDEEEPDPSVLTLDEARIDIRIDHQYARIRIVQIFGNHTKNRLEGKYVFAVPGGAAISDFAVWDGVVRIPGVILERKRASELYENIKLQEIDPGLLQQDEGAEGPRMATTFSASIVPILPYATKRLEMEYTQRIQVEGSKAFFSLPLQPDLYREQRVGKLSISLDVLSDFPLTGFQLQSQKYPMTYKVNDAHHIQGSFEATDIALADDFALQYTIATDKDDLSFLAYRGSEQSLRQDAKPLTVEDKPLATTALEDGYFWTSALFRPKPAPAAAKPRSLILMLDISSSMRWEKLDQAYAALEYFLRQLPQTDEFQLILFHQEVTAQSAGPVAATPANIDSALAFVKTQYLMGGTDFQKALQTAFTSAGAMKNADRYMVLITDGNPTLTQIQTRKLLQQFQDGNTTGMRAFCFGIGTDSNGTLLSGFAEASNGLFDWAGENEDLDFKLEAFFAKIGQYPATNLVLQASQKDLAHSVYPSEPSRIYLGSTHDWFGRYGAPASGVTLSVSGTQEGANLSLQKKVDFPESATEHEFIPRGWARMRVDFLLRKMELEGEDQKSIDEIIALSKKYKFVTPYTSFLAAPRSLLRPRLIRPGDPILRVKTDPDIVSIVAVFPFGLVKQLVYLESEDTWQTRFLVPVDMKDGAYNCNLILRDRAGNQYQEKKSFVVDSKPPVFQTKWDGAFSRGRTVKIVISADSDTRHLYARLQNLPAVRIQWNAQEKASVGYLKVPQDFPSGLYKLEVFGEDFAHNESRWSKQVEVL